MKLVVVLVVATLGCSKREAKPSPTARRELPGFSIELPGGRETTSELDYNAGRIALRVRDQSGWVHVRWSFGPELPDDAALAEIVRGIARGLKMSPGEVHAIKSGVDRTFALDKAERDLITYFRCGSRNILLTTNDVGEPHHTKLGRTFDCHPDPVRETADVGMPIHIELPNFVASERTPGMLVLDDGRTLVRLRGQPSTPMTNEQLDRAFPDLLRANGFEQAKTSRLGELATFTANFEGNPRAGFMRYVKCPDVEVQIFVDSEPALVADLQARVQAARCLKAGEAPPQWPDAPPEEAPPAGSGSN